MLTVRQRNCYGSLGTHSLVKSSLGAYPTPRLFLKGRELLKMERSLVLVKPDGVQRGLIGEVISRLEQRGLRIVAAKFLQVSQELAETHYAIHKGKPFYNGLIEYITSAPVMAMVWEGPNAIAAIRQTMGATRPTEAAPGSVRHDFALEVGRNLTHASDSLENGMKEVDLWFHPTELVDWKRDSDRWIFESA
jgi:nucleoside-diphosphate kinase